MINGLEKGSSGTIIIPTTDTLKIETGDIVVSELCKRPFEEVYKNDDIQKFRIVSVDDNRKGNLQHYKLGVSE